MSYSRSASPNSDQEDERHGANLENVRENVGKKSASKCETREVDRRTLHSLHSEDSSPPLGIPGGGEGEEAGEEEEEEEEEDTDSCHTIQEQGRAGVTLARLWSLCFCFND